MYWWKFTAIAWKGQVACETYEEYPQNYSKKIVQQFADSWGRALHVELRWVVVKRVSSPPRPWLRRKAEDMRSRSLLCARLAERYEKRANR